MSTGSTSLKGAAVVTGSAQGIGLAIALRLAQDGYPIVLNDLPEKVGQLEDVVKEIASAGGNAIFVVGDVSVEQNVKDIVATAVTKFGKLDVMVANAGIAVGGSVADTTVEDWDYVFAINVRSMFLCYREAAVQMVKQGTGGRIVGASSTVGKQCNAFNAIIRINHRLLITDIVFLIYFFIS
jgi:NAD(P)-dependent dehydrogenase (short-subunit alcohol dehydrogenase family)